MWGIVAGNAVLGIVTCLADFLVFPHKLTRAQSSLMVTTKDIPKQCHMAPECQTHPRLRTAALYYKMFIGAFNTVRQE